MAAERFAHVLHYLRTRLGPVGAESTTDGQLVTRFVRDGEIAAFEILMRRHGPLVWRVCRRFLASDHDAEDAFQATFLVLVRKASSIRKQASVASWLYGVAHRIARRACARARQRFGPELADAASSADVLSEASEREVQTILEEELAQLPERLRAPLLLCCLEGRSKTEAARQLGWREGTLSSRLARARSQLRVRLIRRGVALSIGALASLLERRAVAVPINTVVAAMRTVSLYTLGETAASAPAMALARAALQAMFLTKLKIGAALALACGILATGAGFAVQRALDANVPAAVEAEEPKAVAKQLYGLGSQEGAPRTGLNDSSFS
jgi:polysaccharide biosynthesis/export protein